MARLIKLVWCVGWFVFPAEAQAESNIKGGVWKNVLCNGNMIKMCDFFQFMKQVLHAYCQADTVLAAEITKSTIIFTKFLMIYNQCIFIF